MPAMEALKSAIARQVRAAARLQACTEALAGAKPSPKLEQELAAVTRELKKSRQAFDAAIQAVVKAGPASR